MAHYHVVENTPGYMPDTEPSTWRTEKEAEAEAASLAKELQEQGYRVRRTQNGYYAERDDDDLGRVIEILYCVCEEGEAELGEEE